MELLEALVREHPFRLNKLRTNLSSDRVRHGGKTYLRAGVYSNTLRSGRVLELCQEMLGDVNAVCLNRDLCAERHRDKRNAGESYVCYFGSFEGGALVLADGRRFEGTRQWHGPMDGEATEHWNEPHVGQKWSVVAFRSR